MKLYFYLATLCLLISCNHKSVRTESVSINNQGDFVIATWLRPKTEWSTANFAQEEWRNMFAEYKDLGITEVLINYENPEILKGLVDLGKEYDLKIHAWMWTLNRPYDSLAMQHPEWYQVNKLGKNSLEYRAYVDYYQWLSPFHPEAREYIKQNAEKLMAVEGLASIHLDYVRYPDVILGADLQPKYNLVQTTEMPEYDYGYHPIAREKFSELFGVDPIEFEHPELSTEWKQFRLNAVTTLVNEIVELAHQKGQRVTAAVFPFPEMARQMVRQGWNDWHLDSAYPMIYHNFYRQNINWIGFATEQGVDYVNFPIHTGLYIPGFADAKEFKQALDLVAETGAAGVSLFTVDQMTEEQKDVLRQWKENH